jgi:hypothetical protein
MRTVAMSLIAAVFAATPLAAQDHQHHQTGHVHGGGQIAEGWQLRFDRPDSDLEQVMFMTMGERLHARLGPSAIFYRPEMTARGAFQVDATFTERAGERREAYGLIIGGADLQGENQRYTYFVIRQNGMFLIRQRAGAEVEDLVAWTAHEALRQPGEDRTAENALSIVADAATVKFLANGVEVASLPRQGLDVDGIVGLRINHALDVYIDGLAVKPAAAGR